MTDVRAITVKNPWAWAIAHGGKNIENRCRPVGYRGPILIHAGAGWSERGAADDRVADVWGPWHSDGAIGRCYPCPNPDYFRPGIVAVAQLVDVHLAHAADPEARVPCCPPWGELTYSPGRGEGRICVQHFVLDAVRALPEPVPARGRLGLWRPERDVLDAVDGQLPAALGSTA